MNRTLRALALAWWLVFAWSATAVMAADGSPDAPKLFMWEVKSKTTTVYLYGALGMGNNELYPLAPEVLKAYGECDTVAVETDTTDEVAFNKATEGAFYTGEDGIEKHIAADLLAQVKAYSDENSLSWEMGRTMKPYALAFTIMNREIQRAGYDARMDMPYYFIYRARRDNKPVEELEGAASEIAELEALPAAQQEAILRGTMAGIAKNRWGTLLEGEAAAWRRGDLVAYEDLDRASYDDMPDGAAIRERLVHARQPHLLEKLTAYLSDTKKRFVVLGAPHLVGGPGLVTALRSKGFEIVRH
jgi:uncharacterized protein